MRELLFTRLALLLTDYQLFVILKLRNFGVLFVLTYESRLNHFVAGTRNGFYFGGRSKADGAFIGLKALLNSDQRTALGHWKNYHYRPERAVKEVVKLGFDSNCRFFSLVTEESLAFWLITNIGTCFKSFFKQTLSHTTPLASIFFFLRKAINIRALQARLLSNTKA